MDTKTQVENAIRQASKLLDKSELEWVRKELDDMKAMDEASSLYRGKKGAR